MYLQRYPGCPAYWVAQDAGASEANDRPSGLGRSLVERGVVPVGPLSRVPVVSVSLNDQPRALKNEIRLPSAKHRAVHLEGQPEPYEFVMQRSFDAGHLSGKLLSHPGSSDLSPGFFRQGASICAGQIKLMAPRVGLHSRRGLNAVNQVTPIFRSRPESPSPTRVTAKRSASWARLRCRSMDLGGTPRTGKRDLMAVPSGGEVAGPRTVFTTAGPPRSRGVFTLAPLASLRLIHDAQIIPSCELKRLYWQCAARNLRLAEQTLRSGDLFSLSDVESGVAV